MKDLRMGSIELIFNLLAFKKLLTHPQGYAYPRLRIADVDYYLLNVSVIEYAGERTLRMLEH